MCLELRMPEVAVMRTMTGAAALHVLLMRISHAQDAFEMFGWTSDTVFTMAHVLASWEQFDSVMDSRCWRRYPSAVRLALHPVLLEAYRRWTWAMDDVFASLDVMDDLSDNETDAEA